MVETREVRKRLDDFRAACKGAGVKFTPQRLEIYKEVASSTAHPDAEAVYQAVRKRVPSVSLDTVYRTLWMLTDLGLVDTLGPRKGVVRFDANKARHHHFVCVKCGKALDFESEALNALGLPDEVKRFGTVTAVQVEVKGVCGDCAKSVRAVPAR